MRYGTLTRTTNYSSLGDAGGEIIVPCSTGVKIILDYNQHNLGTASWGNWILALAKGNYTGIWGVGISALFNFSQQDNWYHIEIEIDTEGNVTAKGDKTVTSTLTPSDIIYFKITNMNGQKTCYFKNFKICKR